MQAILALALCFKINGVRASGELKFSEDFKFGSATSSYQIEGGWNASDKGPSVWDEFTHINHEVIIDRSTGDIACDSYNKWRDDIQMAADLGLDFYRFSIAWPRILPNGTPEYISKDGARYYNDLINGLLEKGGWTNPLITDWYGDYSRVLYELFGDRVKTWLTINEPLIVCTVNYGMDEFPPNFVDYDVGQYQCIKNLLMAHATAYRIYNNEYRTKWQGRVGLANQLLNFIPATEEEAELTELARQFYGGLYAHPIFSKAGGCPPAIEKTIEENSKAKGWLSSRLPTFSDKEREFVKGTADFYGLNYYSESRIVRKAKDGEIVKIDGFTKIPELRAFLDTDSSWEKGASTWFYVYPEGIKSILNWVKKSFGDVEIIIFENGFPTFGNELGDYKRIKYYKDHLEQVLLAIYEGGVKVTGYTAWSLMDNFEWVEGYTTKFGLYEVDFSSPDRTRTPRDSAHYYKSVIRARSIHSKKYITDEL